VASSIDSPGGAGGDAERDVLGHAFGLVRVARLEVGVHRQRRRADDVAHVRQHRVAADGPLTVGQAAAEGEAARRRRQRLEAELLQEDGAADVPRIGQHETAGGVQGGEAGGGLGAGHAATVDDVAPGVQSRPATSPTFTFMDP
jgi:hypothetical protein